MAIHRLIGKIRGRPAFKELRPEDAGRSPDRAYEVDIGWREMGRLAQGDIKAGEVLEEK